MQGTLPTFNKTVLDRANLSDIGEELHILETMIKAIFILTLILLTIPVNSFFSNLFRNKIKPLKDRPILPITKIDKKPVLQVNDPLTSSDIYLVGVSHGSPSSAMLVKDTITSLKPSAVVLELCPDRYISICIEANIIPRDNQTLIDKYYDTVRKIKARDDLQQTQSLKYNQPISKFLSTLQFISSQGLVAGFFVLISFLGTGSQLLTSNGTQSEDEFVTAIRTAQVRRSLYVYHTIDCAYISIYTCLYECMLYTIYTSFKFTLLHCIHVHDKDILTHTTLSPYYIVYIYNTYTMLI